MQIKNIETQQFPNQFNLCNVCVCVCVNEPGFVAVCKWICTPPSSFCWRHLWTYSEFYSTQMQLKHSFNRRHQNIQFIKLPNCNATNLIEKPILLYYIYFSFFLFIYLYNIYLYIHFFFFNNLLLIISLLPTCITPCYKCECWFKKTKTNNNNNTVDDEKYFPRRIAEGKLMNKLTIQS